MPERQALTLSVKAMPIYIALLRGINIGPHKRMKMEKLRASCDALGLKKVQTFIQSGNVVFQCSNSSGIALAKKLEEQITRDFGFSANVITRTKEEMRNIIANNPFAGQRGMNETKLHIVFLPERATAAAIQKLHSLTLAPDKVQVHGKEVYFYFPKGVSGSSLWKHPLDRVLGVSGTMRNWNTVRKINDLAEKCA